jgi:ribosomal protein S21
MSVDCVLETHQTHQDRDKLGGECHHRNLYDPVELEKKRPEDYAGKKQKQRRVETAV